MLGLQVGMGSFCTQPETHGQITSAVSSSKRVLAGKRG